MNTFSIKEALKHGFERFKEQPLTLAVITLIMLIPGFVLEAGLKLAGVSDSDLHGALTLPDVTTVILVTIAQISFTLLSMILSLGYIGVVLDAEEGVPVTYSDILEKTGLIWVFFLSSILYGLSILAGFILLIIPGIIALVAGTFTQYIVVDEGKGALDSLKRSWEITKGSRWKVFGYILTIGFINILGFLLLGVGLLITVPVTTIGYAFIYRALQRAKDQEVEVLVEVEVVETV